MLDAGIKLRMAEKGFYEVPEFMQTDVIKQFEKDMFKGKAYIFTNPQGSVSFFSYDGIFYELAKG